MEQLRRFRSTETKTSEFVVRALRIHGMKYDYKLAFYTGLHHKIRVLCNKHGLFRVKAKEHLDGVGCPVCASEKLK